MKSQFDKAFRRRVKEAYEAWEPAYNPNHWEALLQKQADQKKQKVAHWRFWGIRAASLFLPVAITIAASLPVGQPEIASSGKQAEATLALLETPVNEPRATSSANTSVAKQSSGKATPTNTSQATYQKSYTKTPSVTSQQVATIPAEDDIEEIIGPFAWAPEEEETIQHANAIASIAQKGGFKYWEDSLTTPLPPSQLAHFHTPSYKKKDKSSDNFKYGIAVTSLTNYSNESSYSGINFGAGLFSELKVSKKISLSTGLVASQQSLATSFGNHEAAMSQDFIAVAASADRSVSQKVATSAEFLALEIPINVQMQLHRDVNTAWYLAMGVSSMTYSGQRFVNTYEVTQYQPRPTFSTADEGVSFNSPEAIETAHANGQLMTTQTEEEQVSESEDFSRFDFARLLNFSVGYSYALGKNYEMVVEPYVKYPLGAVTTEELKMGMSGVNLRLNFGN